MLPHLYIEYVMYDLRVFAPHFSMEIVILHVRKGKRSRFAMAFWLGAWATKCLKKTSSTKKSQWSHVQVYETPLEKIANVCTAPLIYFACELQKQTPKKRMFGYLKVAAACKFDWTHAMNMNGPTRVG